MKLRSLVLTGLLFVTLPLASSFAQVGVSVNFAPPVLPVVEQPPCPVEGYIWTPGYWGYDSDYYWVPGAWVAPPSVGLLWTPAWWGWNNGAYVFNEGYWGPRVGFYGGINYGYGYTGNGYWGGRWVGNNFSYNTYVSNVNKAVIHNTYLNRNVNKQVTQNRASFNGPNGVKAHETAEQKAAAANAKKMGPTSQQLERQNAAKQDPKLQAKNNKGHPNNEAIKSFNQTHGKGAEEVGAAGAAGAGKGENKTGHVAEHEGQRVGKGENQTGDVAEHHGQGAEHGGERGDKHAGEIQGNKHAGQNHGNGESFGGNQAKAHNKSMEHQGAGPGPHAMNQQMHHQRQMGAQHQQQMGGQHQQQMRMQNRQQMGGPRPQTGGNRPRPQGQQQQGKKKQGQY
jgi:hypothetical protein